MDHTMVEEVGDSLNSAERIRFENYLSKGALESSYPGLETLVEGSKQKLKKNYLVSLAREAEALTDSKFINYKKISFTAGNIQAGDICINVDYGVAIPPSEVLYNCCLKNELKENLAKMGIAKITGYVNSVQRKLKHSLGGLSGVELIAMEIAQDELYYQKIIPLETIIEGNLPAVCFEQALTLNWLLSNDPEIKFMGGKARVCNGYLLNRSFVGHTWVTLNFPSAHPECGLDAKQYTLDPSYGKVFRTVMGSTYTRLRYIPQTDKELTDTKVFQLRK